MWQLHAGNAVNVMQEAAKKINTPEVGKMVGNGIVSCAHLRQLFDVAHALAILMDGMQECMVSMACVLSSSADVLGASSFLTEIAHTASRMHARVAGMSFKPALIEHVVHQPRFPFIVDGSR